MSSICFTLPGSAVISPAELSVMRSWMLFWAASGSTVLATSPMTSLTSTVCRRSSIWPASILERSRMSLINPRRCFPLEWICSRNRLRVAGVNWPLPASINSSENPRMALRGVRSSWLMLARKTLLWRFASRSLRLLSSSFVMRCLRSSAVANALMNCWTRRISSAPKVGVKGPERTTRVPAPESPSMGSLRTVWSVSPTVARLTPSGICAVAACRSPSWSGVRPSAVRSDPPTSNATAAAPPTRRIVHSMARLESVSLSSLRSRSSMKARKPSSSDARHSRRSHDGGAKLTYRSGTVARTTSCTTSWTAWLPETATSDTPIANTRMPTIPANPRLKERRRHAWTTGRPRATSQNRIIGSTTMAPHTMMITKAATVITWVGASNSEAPMNNARPVTIAATAATCHARRTGMSEPRKRRSA